MILVIHRLEKLDSSLVMWVSVQRRSQNAEKITHMKGRILDHAMIIFNWAPF